ncbi:MAG TPA: helix-hairpin-helix domain-containing protein [Anaerolineae bacterium]|nr:helix-hairpin-helix domain-containing protein [Anaerolineae bacterium]
MSIVLVALVSLAILIVGFLGGLLVAGVGTTLGSIALLSLPVLMVGFLIGWLVEWIIDNQNNRMREMQRQEVPQAPQAAPAPNMSELAEAFNEVLEERENQIHDLRTQLKAQEARYFHLKVTFDEYVATHPDDLTVIKGIGGAYQRKLREAGYRTYARLAQADAQQLRKALGIASGQVTDPQEWIDRAKALI